MADCSACAAPLAAGAKFCHECGTPVAVPACPSCGTPSNGGKFCSECGTPLTAVAPLVAEPPPAPVAERRITSVLFGDLVGFTPLSESRDAEEVRELLSRYFSECRTVIGRYGGTVEKFIGDAVMAVWGVPVAHEDDAERAVRAGLELASMVAGIGDQVGAPGLAMRVGVVTGEVAVTVGATAEGMVAGDAVNTAARVQSTAQPGTVWVDDGTRSLTSASVAYEDMGEHDLKGKADPLRLFCARAILTDMGGARVDGLEAPMVGRDRELRLVKELFHAAEESGRPRLVVVDGEAGIGKSRLAWEFEKYVDGLKNTVLWHRGRCLSYGDGIAYWALTEAVRTRLGLTEGETGDVVEQRLDEGLARFVPDADERAWLRPRLAVLVRSDRDAAYTRSELFVAWTTWFERLTQTGEPVVLVVDDAQHADDGLLDFAEHLLSNADGAVFVLALARPALLDRRRDLGGRRSTVIHLEPLDADAMAHLVDGLVVGLETGSRSALVQRAEGVPLYAVETIRALIDRDLVVPRDGRYVPADGGSIDLDAIGAPATLHTLVAARLDALSPEERLVVADASVLGATFTREGLVALSGERGDLDEVLNALQRKEIFAVQQDRFAADRGQLRFVQAVVRQVAYATQSKRDRKARHLAAADFLAAASDADDVVQVQAQHLVDALDASATGDADLDGLTARAAEQLARAGRRARSLGSIQEARRLFEQARRLTRDAEQSAELTFLAGEAAREAGAYTDAIELYDGAAAGFDALGLDVRAGIAAGRAAWCWWHTGSFARAIEVAEQRWESLQGRPDADAAVVVLSRALSNAHADQGDRDRAARLMYQRVLAAERLGDPDELALATMGMGIEAMTDGAPRLALSLMESAARLARAGGSLQVQASTLSSVGAHSISRNLAEAERISREACEVARRSGMMGDLENAILNRSLSLWQSGRIAEAAASLDELPTSTVAMTDASTVAIRARIADALGEPLPALAERAVSDDPRYHVWFNDLAITRALATGDAGSASRVADEGMPVVLRAMGIDDDFAVLWPQLVRAALGSADAGLVERMIAPVSGAGSAIRSPAVDAEWHWLRGASGHLLGLSTDEAESALRQGIEQLDAFGARGLAAHARVDLGRLLLAQGRPVDADTVLSQARTAYEDMGAQGWLARLDARQGAGASA